MVKVTFNSSFGQRDLKKACNAEALIPEERDLEDGMRVRRQSKVWCWCMCLGLALMLSGVVVGGAYLYKSYILQGLYCRQKYSSVSSTVWVAGLRRFPQVKKPDVEVLG